MYVISIDYDNINGIMGPVLQADLLDSNPEEMISQFASAAIAAENQRDHDLMLLSQMKDRAGMILAGLRDGH